MKILVVAASCSPYRGSEPSIGWKVSSALASIHEVHSLVFSGHRTELEQACAEGLVPPALHFHFHGPDWERPPAPEVEKSFWWRCYRSFLADIRHKVAQLHAEHHFDLIHHVTFATWRLAVPLHGLGVPFVWGPVGGAERFPPSLLGILSPKAAAFEVARYVGNLVSRMSPSLNRMVRNADALIASNPDAETLLVGMRGSRAGVHPLLVTAFTPEERSRFAGATRPGRQADAPLKAFAGGALEGRKGVSMALDAIALAKKQGLRIHYRVCASGPEKQHLISHAAALGISEDVSFEPPLKNEDYKQALAESDIYLLPSLRDNAPVTLMEAMLAGCIPIVAACGGPDMIVTDECGFRIPTHSKHKLVDGIAGALLRLQQEPSMMARMAAAARARITHDFSMESYLLRTGQIYQDAIRHHQGVACSPGSDTGHGG